MMSKPSSAPSPPRVRAHEAVDGAGEVLGVDDADDVLRLAAEDRDAGVRRVDRLLEDLGRRGLGVDHLDVAAVHHHLLHLALAEVERPEEEVAVRPLHRAFGMVQRDGAGGLLLRGQHGEPGVDLDAEEPEHPPRQGARGARHRREGADDEADHRRDPGRDGLGPGHGQGSRQHLGEDEDGRRHHQRGEEHALRAEEAGEAGWWRARRRGCSRAWCRAGARRPAAPCPRSGAAPRRRPSRRGRPWRAAWPGSRW